MTDQLLQCIANAPGPRTAVELRDAIGRGGHKVQEFEVLKELRKLQSQGVVRLERNRWRLLKMPDNISSAPPPRSPSPVPPPGNSNGRATTTTPITAPIIAAPPEPVGRWGLFRRLCHYYMDCLLQDEAPQLRSYVENEDDTWISIHQVPWARLASNGDFAVSLTREQAPFQRNRARRGDEECVYLCYPLNFVKPNTQSGFVVPIFAQPMTADWRKGILHLKPDGPIAVNGAWLENRFRQRAERMAFLRALGFLYDVDGEDDGDEMLTSQPKNFASLAQDAAHYIHDAEKFAEHIEPMSLNTASDWEKAVPGLYNSAMLTLGPRLRYTRSLIRDLRDISEKFSDDDLDQTALAALFPHDEPIAAEADEVPPTDETLQSIPAYSPDQLAQTRLLHPTQRAAVANSLGEAVSVVTGPPGTGKSEVVAAMLLNQLLRGQPALFASKNHQALDSVLPRLNGAVEGGDLIIQASNRDLAQRQSYLGKLQDLLSRPPRNDADRGEELHQDFSDLFERQRDELSLIASLEQSRAQYETLNTQLEALRKSLPLPAQSEEGLAGWPRVLTPDVVESLIAELRGALTPPNGFFQRLWHLLRRTRVDARRLAAREPFLNFPLPLVGRSLPTPGVAIDDWAEFFPAWKTWAEASHIADLVKACEQRLVQLPRSEISNDRLSDIQQAIEKLTNDWMAWAAGGLPNPLTPSEREGMANLRAGIQNWGASRFAKELKQRFPLILRAFPLWSVSNLSARSALPLIPGLFDLVIVDEASQCDIPSVVPLLARSKRAVFAGDPMQLQHVSNLNSVVDQTLLQQHGLTNDQVQRFTYRVNSAFDLADASAAVPAAARVRLDLHFRSHDLIADYCNEAFYGKSLHVVTVTDRLNIPRGMQPGIHWTHVAGSLQRGKTGAWCSEEVEAVHEQLVSLESGGYRGTIGVVTPFRAQMIRLKDALEASDSLTPEFMERVRFLAATAHGFQGDERDLILFSLCGGPELPDGAKTFLSTNPNLFNVAVSRARAVLHVVGNRDWALACGVSFIEKLALRTDTNFRRTSQTQRDPYQSPWEKVLADALQEAGIKFVPQYPIAGRFLDLGILSPRKIDVEVDGEAFHRTAGGGRKDDDYWRDLQLQSLGWDVCRFWVYELREDLPRCVRRIQKLLEKPPTP